MSRLAMFCFLNKKVAIIPFTPQTHLSADPVPTVHSPYSNCTQIPSNRTSCRHLASSPCPAWSLTLTRTQFLIGSSPQVWSLVSLESLGPSFSPCLRGRVRETGGEGVTRALLTTDFFCRWPEP